MYSRRRFIQHAGLVAGALLSPREWATVLAAETEASAADAILHREFPLCREPQPHRLAAGFITRQADFYVRNHGTIPRLAEAGYTVRIERPGAAPASLPLAELKRRYPHRTLTAVMQCAGNRRADMGGFKPVAGDAWHAGAISNATWTGVGLGDVLRSLGVREDANLHVAFGGHDDVEENGERFKYGVSIPLAKAMASESLLAFAMNGEALTAEHGFPLRVVTPGYAGARSPKWLASISVQDRPSDNYIQQKVYKLFPPDVTAQTADLSQGAFINEMPLNSAILVPAAAASTAAGKTTVRGYAIATTARVTRVELSVDGGGTWRPVKLDAHDDAPWSWTPWSTVVDLPKGKHELAVRAFDSAGGRQPESPASIWNYRGYLSRAWHRVVVEAV